MVDVRVSVGDDGAIMIRFEGINGSPIVSGICVKKAANFPGISTFLIFYFSNWQFETYINKTTFETNVVYCNFTKASKVKHECLVCNKCAAEIEVSSDQVSYISSYHSNEFSAFNVLSKFAWNI